MLGLLGFAALLELLPRLGVVDAASLPPTSRILRALVDVLGTASFWTALGETMRAWAIGLTIASVAAAAHEAMTLTATPPPHRPWLPPLPESVDEASVGVDGLGLVDLPDEQRQSVTGFLVRALRWFKSLGIRVERVMTDNGSGYVSRLFRKACRMLRLRHLRTRPYTPKTNGKAERFIQSALREWAYGFTYQRSAERTQALDDWIHHYNWHRPHQGIGGISPMTRLMKSRNNLLTLHT